MNLDIIMVSGKMHSGKGTFSELLEKELKQIGNKNIIRCSLSDYIREIVVKDFYHEGSQDIKECRDFMAIVYELGTKLYPHHKARRVWERDILPYLIEGDNVVVIESFREKNDIEYFYTKEIINQWDNMYTIRVTRSHEDYDMKDNHLVEHISEIDLDDYDFNYYINNDSGKEKLRKSAKNIIKTIIK